MPTRRWMYISPISLLFVVLELGVMFGVDFSGVRRAVLSAPEDLNGKFFVFVALMVGQAGLWGYLLCLCGEWMWQIWQACKSGPSLGRLPRHYRVAIVTRFLFAMLSVLVWYYIVRHMRPDWDLGPYQTTLNIRDAGLLGFIPGVLGVCGMWIVEITVYSSLPVNEVIDRSQLNCYLRLRDYLGYFLTATAIILALGTLDINASRELIKAASEHNKFPHDLVVLFGGIFTVLLGMAYAPAYLALRNLGCEVRDAIVPEAFPSDSPGATPAGEYKSVRKWANDRKKLAAVLQLEIRDWKSFGPQFAIIAPLATGLASRVIGAK